eukprot:tig00001093_g6887.t1
MRSIEDSKNAGRAEALRCSEYRHTHVEEAESAASTAEERLAGALAELAEAEARAREAAAGRTQAEEAREAADGRAVACAAEAAVLREAAKSGEGRVAELEERLTAAALAARAIRLMALSFENDAAGKAKDGPSSSGDGGDAAQGVGSSPGPAGDRHDAGGGAEGGDEGRGVRRTAR